MKYIIEILGKYYVRCYEDGSWEECYNPHVATKFNTVNDALEWAYKKTTLGEYCKAVEYSPVASRFDNWVAGGMVRRTFNPLSQYSIKYDPAVHDKFAVLNWWVHKDEGIRSEDYRTWPELYSLFKHLHSVINYSDGSRSFDLTVAKDASFSEFQEELNLVINEVTKDREGDISLVIFDHYLCEGGNQVELVKHEDETWSIRARYYDVIEKSTLEECFEYIRKERYYPEEL